MRIFLVTGTVICYLLLSAGWFVWSYTDFNKMQHQLFEWLLFFGFIGTAWLVMTYIFGRLITEQ